VLAAHDVFVPSSVHEGASLSEIEAMDAGKPVIATEIDGMRLGVKPSINGLLIPPADPAALDAAMSDLAVNPTLRQEMGLRRPQIVRDSFSIANIINRYQDNYESVLGDRDVRN